MPRKDVSTKTSGSSVKPTRPKLTPEACENECICLAYDLVRKRLQEGTASSAETTYFLKLASEKNKLEENILKKQKELLEAKTDSLRSEARTEALYSEAINAMRIYGGHGNQSTEDPNDEE